MRVGNKKDNSQDIRFDSRHLNSRPNILPSRFAEDDSSIFHCFSKRLNLWNSLKKQWLWSRKWLKRKKIEFKSLLLWLDSQRQSGMSRELPCTPSWWCPPAGIAVPAPHLQLDTLPHILWKPAPSSAPTLWLNRTAPEQENCWRTPVPSRSAECEKTPIWKEA